MVHSPISRTGQIASFKVSGSSEKITDKIDSGTITIGAPINTIVINASLTTSQPHADASSTFFAPSAWPTRVAAANPIPIPGSKTISQRLIKILPAATSATPISPIIQNITINPAAKNSCCIPFGRESFTSFILLPIDGRACRKPCFLACRIPKIK